MQAPGIHEAAGPTRPAALRLRSLRAADADQLVAGFARLSREARYLRWFHPKKQLSAAEVADLTHPDHCDREAVAAFSAGGHLLGVARFVRDRYQGHGVGTSLLREISDRARRAGVIRLRADILAGNRRMLDLAFRLWPAHHSVHRGGGVVEVEFDLGPVGTPAPAAA